MKTSWDQLIFDSIPTSRNGLYYANQEICLAIKNNPVGYYIYTKKSSYKDNRYKIGQTTKGLSRIKVQASEDEIIIIIGWIASDQAFISGSDQKIHEYLHKQQKCDWIYKLDPKSAPGKEWSRFSNNNPEEIWRDYLGNNISKTDLELTIWQMESLDKILSFLADDKKTIMAELAARHGKTTLYLSLLSLHDSQVMVVGSYYLTALSSFKKEITLYNQFSNFKVLDLSDSNFKKNFDSAIISKNKIVVIASLCGSEIVNSNSTYIENFKNKIIVIDEADYGAHTDKVLPLVNRLSCSSPIILTTGTNTERAQSKHKIDAFLSCSYFDMLLMKDTKERIENKIINSKYNRAHEFEKKLSQVKFYRFDWSVFVPLLDNNEKDLNPSFTKASVDVQKNHGLWHGLYRSLIGENINVNANDYSLFNFLEEPPQSIIQFVNMNKKEQEKLYKIANPILNEFYDVCIVNGNNVRGKDCEEYIKNKIRLAKKHGKHVWIIASQMCQRSFSIPDINVSILSYDKGEQGANIQKMSRTLTAGSNKQTGNIISLSIDGNRDEKITPMILDTAKKLANRENLDIVTSIRKVLKSLPIFQMGGDGYLVQLKADDYAKELFSSSNSNHLIINKNRLMTFSENDSSYLILMDLDITEIEKNKSEISFSKGKTFLNPESKISSVKDKNVINEMRIRLNNIVDRINYCVKEISKTYGTINYNQFINLLNKNCFIRESIGLKLNDFETLINEDYIDKSLLSMLIECGI
jgi:hypothetical protein